MMKQRIISVSLALVLMASVSYAVIPVTDAGLIATTNAWGVKQESSRWVQHAQQIAKWIEQIRWATAAVQEAKNAQNYRVLIDGAWRRAVERMPSQKTGEFCKYPIDLSRLGWRDLEKYQRVASIRSALGALDEYRRIVDARSTGSEARAVMETVWGAVPVTETGIQVEGAYRAMATAADASGKLNSAIQECEQNVARLERDIASGAYTPVELERKKGQLQIEQTRSNLLVAQSMNQANQLSIQQVGMEAGRISATERARLRGGEQLSGWFSSGAVRFSPAIETRDRRVMQ